MEAIAKLRNDQSSPRKMRMVADLIRNKKVSHALAMLKFEPRAGAEKLEKLLLSAIANWQEKNPDEKIEEAGLFVKAICVDGGRILKRIRPAPQGRAHRIRKRSNHVTIVIGDQLGKSNDDDQVVETEKTAAQPTQAVAAQ